jgi:hypothetical protein
VENSVVYVKPFQVGWKVSYQAPNRRERETVTGDREVALEVARYHAQRRSGAVVICRPDGTVEQTLQCDRAVPVGR